MGYHAARAAPHDAACALVVGDGDLVAWQLVAMMRERGKASGMCMESERESERVEAGGRRRDKERRRAWGRESEIEVESTSGIGREAGRRIQTVGRMGVGREEARLLAMWRVARLLAPKREARLLATRRGARLLAMRRDGQEGRGSGAGGHWWLGVGWQLSACGTDGRSCRTRACAGRARRSIHCG